MTTVRVLSKLCSFDDLAHALDDTELELRDVISSTFPSRPEPRRATWTTDGGELVFAYHFLPDIELRTVCEFNPPRGEAWEWAEGLATELGPQAFETWQTLKDELWSGDYRKVFRAAHAFATACRVGDTDVASEEMLLLAAEECAGHTRQAASAALVEVASNKSEARIARLFEETDNPAVRLDLFRTLERIRTRL
jgi:hypothetical protein